MNSLAGFLIILLFVIAVLLFFLYRKTRKQIRRLREQHARLYVTIHNRKEEFREEACNEALAFFEKELQRVGADLHDDLIQKLSHYVFMMERISKTEDLAHAHAYAMQLKSELNLSIIPSIRKISGRLLPGSINSSSLTVALGDLCSFMETPGKAHIHYKTSGDETTIGSTHQEHMVRIVQELINNIMNHTKAWHIWVTLVYEQSRITISVEDDDIIGVEAYKKEYNRPNNFRTLKMRIKAIHGNLRVSIGKKGTKVDVVYPLLV